MAISFDQISMCDSNGQTRATYYDRMVIHGNKNNPRNKSMFNPMEFLSAKDRKLIRGLSTQDSDTLKQIDIKSAAIVVLEGDSPPQALGSRATCTDKAGKPTAYPRSHRELTTGDIIYTPSTLRIEVGLGWICKNIPTFDIGKLFCHLADL